MNVPKYKIGDIVIVATNRMNGVKYEQAVIRNAYGYDTAWEYGVSERGQRLKEKEIIPLVFSQEPPKEKECNHCFCEAGYKCCLCGKIDSKPELDVESLLREIIATLKANLR